MNSKTTRGATVSSITSAKSKAPVSINLSVNGQRVDPTTLEGLGLATLESLLCDLDSFLSTQHHTQHAFTSGLREVIKARAKGGSSCITIDVTSSLDSKTRTLSHQIKVR